MNIRNDLINNILNLYKEGDWKEIVDRYHDHPDRSKVLWVFPTGDNLEFIRDYLSELCCCRILSIGCGSGLLEWIITNATGIPVSGVEVDGAWWHCKYAPPTFIPLLLTPEELDKDIINILQSGNNTALLFCYFNNRNAFEEYIKCFSGNVMIIIGPGDGKGVHTDPKPFGDVNDDWELYKWQEVRNSKDFIAVYIRNKLAC
ncbi:uncharacterized protein LOC128672320 [Plodia interpunctella]|uniref:uncharacterized protein LOC128672320 n=1 Tax=Plodia interpunctella TaxID=58824 RepID=UPI002368E9FC|nr:uncharacterized protein LOC128672320 [Plodia interpunctella]